MYMPLEQLARRFLLLLFCLSVTWPAAAANHAFVVGNGSYTNAPHLPNPLNDARDIASKLTAKGYSVRLALNLSRTDFLAEFRAFTRTLRSDDLALFFFAGHGIQIGGENYLFPVDANVRDENDARTVLVSLNTLLADLSRAARSRIVILDACRNNPFASEIERSLKVRAGGLSRGLARVYSGIGSFITYSTQPGNVAADGAGRNSPFARSLLQHMGTEGADVHAVMRRVRNDVRRATNGLQIPWENSSLINNVSFASGISRPTTSTHIVTGATSAMGGGNSFRENRRETYHFVTGLNPRGDNFLALKTGPGIRFRRLATMGPNTLLKIIEKRGMWRRVVLIDGARGWAHGRWIKCCKTINRLASAVPSPNVRTSPNVSCNSLWRARNAIFHRHRYCFNSTRGRRTFDNTGCFRDQAQASAAMLPSERKKIAALLSRERAMGCR